MMRNKVLQHATLQRVLAPSCILLQELPARLFSVMAKGLAKKWETVARVRNRFRNGQDWLKLKIGGDGTTRVAACATSFRQNAEIVSCMLQTSGLEKQGLPALTKQVGQNLHAFMARWELQSTLTQVASLFQKMGFIPEDPKQAKNDAKLLKSLFSYVLRRTADAERRGQVAREAGL